MAYAFKKDGDWHEILGQFTLGTDAAAVTFPAEWPRLASPNDRAAFGIVEIQEAASIAPWLREAGRSISDVAGHPVRQIQTMPIPDEELSASLAASVNAAAGAFRRRYVTDITGQEATYLDKETEARAFVATGELMPDGYVAIEAEQTGRTPEQIAAIIIGNADAWRPINRRVEGRRQGALSVIASDTATPAQKWTAAQIDWDALAA